MLTLRKHAMISVGLFLMMLLVGWSGSGFQAYPVWKDPQHMQAPMRIAFFAMFIAFAFSLVPTILKLLIAARAPAGNARKSPVRFVDRHQVGIVWGFWILSIAGLIVPLRAMIHTGFFTSMGEMTAANMNSKLGPMTAQGTLRAAPGMKVDEMMRESTLRITRGSLPGFPNEKVYSGGTIFNFHVAGIGIEFPRCRYYFITTYTRDPGRVESINVGTAQRRMTRAELDTANAALRARLRADGWLAGREVNSGAKSLQPHGAHTRSDEANLWLKGDTTLDIGERRLDDSKPGEGVGAGQWIQFVDLRARNDYPSIQRYVFAPPQS